MVVRNAATAQFQPFPCLPEPAPTDDGPPYLLGRIIGIGSAVAVAVVLLALLAAEYLLVWHAVLLPWLRGAAATWPW